MESLDEEISIKDIFERIKENKIKKKINLKYFTNYFIKYYYYFF